MATKEQEEEINRMIEAGVDPGEFINPLRILESHKEEQTK